jgi:hypothetical protein
MIVENLSKLLITTIFLFILLEIRGGEIFASLASLLYDGAVGETWKMADRVCRMSFVARQTCTHQNRSRKTRQFLCQQPPRQLQMTIRRHSTVARKTRRQKSRLKLALCLATLPIIINAKAFSSFNTFSEGVSSDTDSFPIAIYSGTTDCLSDRRSDFEGALIRVKVKIQGITKAKGIFKQNQWTIQDDNGKTHVFTTPNMFPCRLLSLSQEHRSNKTDTMKSGTRVIMGEDEFHQFKAFTANINQ